MLTIFNYSMQMISFEEKTNAMNLARESEGVPHIALSMLK